MGGTHDFHDTKENESSHKECVKTAGERARIYTDVNLSAYNMLQFNMQREWLDSIFDIRLGVSTVSGTDGSEAESLKQIRFMWLLGPIRYRKRCINGSSSFTHVIGPVSM